MDRREHLTRAVAVVSNGGLIPWLQRAAGSQHAELLGEHWTDALELLDLSLDAHLITLLRVTREALLVDVQTMVASDAPSLGDLRPVTDPLELPKSSRGFAFAMITMLLVVLAGLILVL